MARPIYGYDKNYHSRNMEVFKNLLKVHVENDIKPKLVSLLHETAQVMVDWIDGAWDPPVNPIGPVGSDEFPTFTSNLHDATGVGVYLDGVLTKYLPTKRATEPQESTGHPEIWGAPYLDEALAASVTDFRDGLWIVLFSAVPYAYEVSTEGSPLGRGVNFFQTSAKLMASQIFAGLRPLTDYSLSGSLSIEFGGL